FPDQPAVNQARAKLAALHPPAPPTAMTMRKIEFSDTVQNVEATDGQKAVYWNSSHTALYFGDVKGKDKRIVFEPKGIVPKVFVSRDLTTAFLFFERVSLTGSAAYAVVKTDGTGYRELILTVNGNNVQFPALQVSWSWDNRYLTMYTPGIYVFKVSLENGELL